MKISDLTKESEAIATAAARWVARRDAGLQPAEVADFEKWLAADPRNAAALEHYAQAWSVLDCRSRAGVEDDVLREVKRRIRRRRVRRIQGVSAGLAIVALVALFQPAKLREDPLTVAASAEVVVLQPELEMLPDGSRVELKAGAKIVAAFTAKVRRVELQRGEAHFQVARNPERPFVVQAGGVEIHAIGTAFSVQLNRDVVEVLVTEGRVAVEKSTGHRVATELAPQPLAIFGAGHRLVVELAATPDIPLPLVQSVPLAELAERLAWRSPRLEFSGTPLATAIALMNRAADERKSELRVRLILDPGSPELATEPISGLFRADNTEAFAHMLELSLNVRAERRGEEIILHKAK